MKNAEISTFCGKPIDDMSREELIEVVRSLARMIHDAVLEYEMDQGCKGKVKITVDRALRHHDMQQRMREARNAFWNAELERLRRPFE